MLLTVFTRKMAALLVNHLNTLDDQCLHFPDIRSFVGLGQITDVKNKGESSVALLQSHKTSQEGQLVRMDGWDDFTTIYFLSTTNRQCWVLLTTISILTYS